MVLKVIESESPMKGMSHFMVEDENGDKHSSQAFKTEIAEQMNARLDRFKSLLSQMSNVSFNFYMHVLLMLYNERIKRRIGENEHELAADFWDQ